MHPGAIVDPAIIALRVLMCKQAALQVTGALATMKTGRTSALTLQANMPQAAQPAAALEAPLRRL